MDSEAMLEKSFDLFLTDMRFTNKEKATIMKDFSEYCLRVFNIFSGNDEITPQQFMREINEKL